MSDAAADQPKTITKVVIATPGVSVTIESAESLALVSARTQEIHREAHERCAAALPSGFGGAL